MKRYIFDDDTETMMESADGEYVLYTDAVKAQRDGCRKCHDAPAVLCMECSDIKAENTVRVRRSADHEADAREREKKAFVEGAWYGRVVSGPIFDNHVAQRGAEAEAARRYKEEEGMKRFRANEQIAIENGIIVSPMVVFATDYDALLAVLRQCVGAIVQLNARVCEALSDDGTENNHTVDLRNILKQGKAALAAARPYLERKEEEK